MLSGKSGNVRSDKSICNVLVPLLSIPIECSGTACRVIVTVMSDGCLVYMLTYISKRYSAIPSACIVLSP